MSRFPAALLLLAFLPGLAQADSKHLQSAAVRLIRSLQNEDGTYGPEHEQPLATIRVLRALARCRDHYTTQDGPFVRRAVEALLNRQGDDGGFGEGEPARRARVTAEAIVALRGTAKLERYREARERALRFLLSLEDDARSDPFTAHVASGGDDFGEAAARVAGIDVSSLDREAAEEAAARAAAALEEAIARGTEARADELADRLLVLLDLEEALRRLDLAASSAAPSSPPDRAEQERRIRLALAWLSSQQRDGRFGFGDVADPGITALALQAVIRAHRMLGEEPPAWVHDGLSWLCSLQKPDGGIYELGLKNYITSVAIEALSAAGDERFKECLDRAVQFLLETQLDEGEGYSVEEDPYYGGFGYGSSEKPDLSNTQMALGALHEAGLPPDHEAYRKAILFLEKCQNRRENGAGPIVRGDDKVVVPGDDGGAVYRPGDSKAGLDRREDGTWVARSYGSMTYALLKSYLFCGLDPEDPRVQDAVRWIQEHFRLDVNPGFRQDGRSEYQGLYYYYLTLARALDALGVEELEGPGGERIRWRDTFLAHLFSKQAADGHWVNDRSSRWMEGNPVLTTSYAVLAWCSAARR